MKLHTKWKRVYNPIIGVKFFDYGEYTLGFFTIEKIWQCKEYTKGAQWYDGTRWTHWFEKEMIQIKTDTGLVYKIPFFPWMKVYDERGEKSLADYYNKNCCMSKKRIK